MNKKVLKELKRLRETLQEIIDSDSERLIYSTQSPVLRVELQKTVLDLVEETLTNIDTITDNIDNEEYTDDDNGFD